MASARRTAAARSRRYRLAVAATGEYTAFHGGTVTYGSGAAIVERQVNRVNGLYERDLTIRLVLVANNWNLVYTNASTDPYTNNGGQTMLGPKPDTPSRASSRREPTTTSGTSSIDRREGRARADSVGASAPQGRGARRDRLRRPSPVGDTTSTTSTTWPRRDGPPGSARTATFNGTSGSVRATEAATRNASTAYEPGSGWTIMGYAGICGSADDLRVRLRRHLPSSELCRDRAVPSPRAGACGVNGAARATRCRPSTAAATTPVPKGTPFTLTTVSADDANQATR
jgi:hypothetical protein